MSRVTHNWRLTRSSSASAAPRDREERRRRQWSRVGTRCRRWCCCRQHTTTSSTRWESTTIPPYEPCNIILYSPHSPAIQKHPPSLYGRLSLHTSIIAIASSDLLCSACVCVCGTWTDILSCFLNIQPLLPHFFRISSWIFRIIFDRYLGDFRNLLETQFLQIAQLPVCLVKQFWVWKEKSKNIFEIYSSQCHFKLADTSRTQNINIEWHVGSNNNANFIETTVVGSFSFRHSCFSAPTQTPPVLLLWII